MTPIFNSNATGFSQRFDARGRDLPLSIFASNIGAADTAALQFPDPDDPNTEASDVAIGIGGNSVGVGADADSNVLVINQPGNYRIKVTNASGNTIRLWTVTPRDQ